MVKNGKKGNHLNLLCDIGDLTNLLAGSISIDHFLQRTVEMVARYLDAHVCSIYMYDEASNELVLAATIGLNPDAVGKVRMKLGDGLVGFCLDQLEPVCEGVAGLDARFKYFKEADEDRFQSLLVVPIHRGPLRIGALVVQHEQANYFDENDIMALRAAASQLAPSIENARLLIEVRREKDLQENKQAEQPFQLIKVKIASGGFAYAPVTIFRKNRQAMLYETLQTDSSYTVKDFHEAISLTEEQMQNLQDRFSKLLPESASLIFTTHFMMLKDISFVGEMIRLIEQGIEPLTAITRVALHYINLFLANTHEYIREKANDVEDLALRIVHNLKRFDQKDTLSGEKSIVVASQLYPSDILKLVANDVQGIILVGGGLTAHISILSRSLQIPLVITEEPQLLKLPDNTPVLIDAHIGNIYINPSQEIVQKFQERSKVNETAERSYLDMQPITKTLDGVRVQLLANINLLSEVSLARQMKAEGVGLYRTEFPFLIRPTFPSETEQYLVYKRLFDEMHDLDVTIRTLDVGGEKILSYMDTTPDPNPDLGLRSIRFTLKHRDIFETQIRAMLRAAADSPKARIMFPMISTLDQFLEARQVVLDCIEALSKENLSFNPHPAIGMMVELPSVLEVIDDLADAADFFSIGTNDFIQYMLAVDRTNQKVSDYYCAHDPSVLRGLSKVVDAALRKNKDVSVCGEMAHVTNYIPFLLGIGIRQLSVDPQFLPEVQQCVTGMNMPDASEFAHVLLSQSTRKGVESVMAEDKWQKLFSTAETSS